MPAHSSPSNGLLTPETVEAAPKTTLTEALICEGIEDGKAVFPGVVVSVDRKRVYCLSTFDPVVERTVIYHKWYRRDVLSATIKLRVNPPRWSTFSNMQLRESDRGPWQVKITDADGNPLRSLRFSITD